MRCTLPVQALGALHAAVMRCQLPVQAIARALSGPGGGRLRVADAPRSAGGGPPGGAPLQHFLYKAHARRQFVMPAWAAPLTLPSLQQVRAPVQAQGCHNPRAHARRQFVMPAWAAPLTLPSLQQVRAPVQASGLV